MYEEVILVDESDTAIGSMEKMEAHKKGLLHRAFSVFIFNGDGKLLLQQRALTKYHSAGLWTNSCCSHPRPNENLLTAAKRRLFEEMGLDTELIYKTAFVYRSSFDNGLIEHEYDHIYVGVTEKDPIINKEEVEAYAWKNIDAIKKEIEIFPDKFTTWFKIALNKFF